MLIAFLNNTGYLSESPVLIEALLEEVLSVFSVISENWPIFHENGFLLFSVFSNVHLLDIVKSLCHLDSVQENVGRLESDHFIIWWEEDGAFAPDEIEIVSSWGNHLRVKSHLVVQLSHRFADVSLLCIHSEPFKVEFTQRFHPLRSPVIKTSHTIDLFSFGLKSFWFSCFDSLDGSWWSIFEWPIGWRGCIKLECWMSVVILLVLEALRSKFGLIVLRSWLRFIFFLCFTEVWIIDIVFSHHSLLRFTEWFRHFHSCFRCCLFQLFRCVFSR